MKTKSLFIILLLTVLSPLYSQSLINKEESIVKINAEADLGFISILKHTIQNGSSGTNFNYKEQGGQDILFPFSRYQIGLDYKNNSLIMLYQPLEVVTNVNFRGDVIIDSTTFTSGTPMEITYSFPFWRMTYLYDFLDNKDTTLAIGASLQLRNASILFKEISGNQLTVSQNLGPVPALSFLFEKDFKSGLFVSYDATGSYASSSLFNGASFDFEGSLLDTSIKVGLNLKNDMKWFLSFRFLGGSATGNSEYVNRTWSESLSSYTDNKLATFIITTGVRLY